jgi:hypothetical protein
MPQRKKLKFIINSQFLKNQLQRFICWDGSFLFLIILREKNYVFIPPFFGKND